MYYSRITLYSAFLTHCKICLIKIEISVSGLGFEKGHKFYHRLIHSFDITLYSLQQSLSLY